MDSKRIQPRQQPSRDDAAMHQEVSARSDVGRSQPGAREVHLCQTSSILFA